MGLIAVTVGCQGPRALQGSFIGYSAAYAEISNEQMLLNLARSANSHPVYFLQMGPINSTFQFGANGGGNIGQARTRASGGAAAQMPGLTDTVNFGGQLGATVGEQPSFNFTPLNGSSFAAAVFNPIDPKIFFNLYDQGWPVDQLLRTMVSTLSIPEKGGLRTFMNVLDLERPQNYRNFLTIAGIARELQKRHLLFSSTNHTGFVVAEAGYKLMEELQKDEAFRYESDPNDFTPLDSATLGISKAAGISLGLRTFQGVITALANESEAFDYFVAEEGDKFLGQIPTAERRPILRITPDKTRKMEPPVVSITYRGQHYVIADVIVDNPATKWVEVDRWNRQVFDLLNLLYVQIALDPSKLPVQQLIQIH